MILEDLRYQLGIDIGGTFTDLSVVESRSGRRIGLKTPTVPNNLARGVANGIALLADHGIQPAQIEYFVHGTTIALNAIIQRAGSRIALLVTEGFRDVLEQGRIRLPIPWDFYSQRPEPLLPRELVLGVRERIRYGGGIEVPLTEAEIQRVVNQLSNLDIEGVGICLLHSYANPAHELALKAALNREMSHLFVSSSAEVWPEMREYERTVVTVTNAYVRPVLSRYLSDLELTLRDLGVAVRPYVTRSNGGIMTTDTAKEEPVQTLLSGPASGVVGAISVGMASGFNDLITFDMGGTSADIAVVENGQVGYSREERVGDFPMILPAIGISSIGAGGGSIAWLDGAGVLKVGPASAGADPGPACYGLGGTEPTLSDAFLICGYLNAFRFAGKAQLDVSAALTALSRVADPLGLRPRETADAIIQVALANMYAEFSAVLERKGLDPRDFTLVAFGGAGPLVACQLAEEVNLRRVLIPPSPGTLSALGALNADVMSDFIRTANWRLDEPRPKALETALDDLSRRAASWLEQEAPAVARTELQWSADMQYVGQSYEIEIPLEEAWIRRGDVHRIAHAFHATHERIFYHSDPVAPVEIVNLRARAVGFMPLPRAFETRLREERRAPAVVERSVAIDGVGQQAQVYQRSELEPGRQIAGLAIVEQADSTSVIPIGWEAVVDRDGNLIMTQEVGS